MTTPRPIHPKTKSHPPAATLPTLPAPLTQTAGAPNMGTAPTKKWLSLIHCKHLFPCETEKPHRRKS
ncbi:hypothetical protein BAG01nite_12980 [Brevibacillus agri]|uniref:Uncharacterized protein n=1 Tax=Brevibacillus agri TaxID=51101 RepID=A0ABQ0SMV6_9BACL|nr:hypothetical protein BAG01nite_12980 [Brevibacillus agri]